MGEPCRGEKKRPCVYMGQNGNNARTVVIRTGRPCRGDLMRNIGSSKANPRNVINSNTFENKIKQVVGLHYEISPLRLDGRALRGMDERSQPALSREPNTLTLQSSHGSTALV